MILALVNHRGKGVWRDGGGWMSSGCNSIHKCPQGHSSFLEAVKCCYGGHQTLDELVTYLKETKITLEECIHENEEGTLLVLRSTWITEYLVIKREYGDQIGRTKKKHLKPTRRMKKIVFNLNRLRKTIQVIAHIRVWACLEEAIGQFENLLDIPAKEW